MERSNTFFRLTKVDVEKRLVWGRATQEVVDKSGEILDYEKSKPHFQEWSQEVAKDTDGKSLGNLRAMHGKVAAGKLTDIQFNDTEKAIDICAKVVDDAEWNKTMEGVYTGFSIGGSYVGPKKMEKVGGVEVARYVAKPSEISLVDRPCVPTAKFFDICKADGTVEKKEFKEAEALIGTNAQPAVQKIGDAEVQLGAIVAAAHKRSGLDVAKWNALPEADRDKLIADEVAAMQKDAQVLEVNGTDEQVRELATLMHDGKMDMGAVVALVKAEQERRSKLVPSPEAIAKRVLELAGKVAQPSPELVKQATDELTAELKKAAEGPIALVFADEAGKALAIHDLPHAKHSFIVASSEVAKKRYGDKHPALLKAITDNISAMKGTLPDLAKVERKELRKGLMNVSWFAQLLDNLCSLCECVEWEQYAEGDDTGLCAAIRLEIGVLGRLLQRMVAEEVAEEVGGDPADIAAHGAMKAMHDRLGALHKDDASFAQKVHDMCKGMGASCGTEKLAGAGDDSALTKALGTINSLEERIKKLEAQPAATKLQLHLIGAAVKKGDDTGAAEHGQPANPIVTPVADSQGKVSEAATLIKAIHTGQAVAVQGSAEPK